MYEHLNPYICDVNIHSYLINTVDTMHDRIQTRITKFTMVTDIISNIYLQYVAVIIAEGKNVNYHEELMTRPGPRLWNTLAPVITKFTIRITVQLRQAPAGGIHTGRLDAPMHMHAARSHSPVLHTTTMELSLFTTTIYFIFIDALWDEYNGRG